MTNAPAKFKVWVFSVATAFNLLALCYVLTDKGAERDKKFTAVQTFIIAESGLGSTLIFGQAWTEGKFWEGVVPPGMTPTNPPSTLQSGGLIPRTEQQNLTIQVKTPEEFRAATGQVRQTIANALKKGQI